MKVDREKLTQHLAKIACGGKIDGVVFTGQFKTMAISGDTYLFVDSPALDDATPLDEAIGVPWLDQLATSLKLLAPEGVDGKEVDVAVADHRLVITEKRGKLKLILSAPKTIGTFVSDKLAASIRGAAPDDGEEIALTAELRAGIVDTFQAYKAEEMELSVGPNGTRIRVGGENSNNAEFEHPDLKAAEVYTMTFKDHLVAVLKTISPSTPATIKLKQGAPLLLESDGFRYILAQKVAGADA